MRAQHRRRVLAVRRAGSDAGGGEPVLPVTREALAGGYPRAHRRGCVETPGGWVLCRRAARAAPAHGVNRGEPAGDVHGAPHDRRG